MNRLPLLIVVLLAAFAACEAAPPGGAPETVPSFPALVADRWDAPASWQSSGDDKSTITVAEGAGLSTPGLAISYALKSGGGWVQMKHPLPASWTPATPISFIAKAQGGGNLEVKFTDADGSTFLRHIPLAEFREWKQVVVYLSSTEYGWGGDDQYGTPGEFFFAISGEGSGTVILDEIGLAPAGTKATYPPAGAILDPDRELPGIGFRQRRDTDLAPEDTAVLEWLKAVQDASSPEKAGIPSMEDNQLQTFNNALCAMAFLVKGERERAERILDMYAEAALDRENRCKRLQSFHYRGEPRGFFQFVNLKDEGDQIAFHNPGPSDRWMGDLAWLLIAYKHHERLHGGAKYAPIRRQLLDLLKEWYTDDEASGGGYVRHGWRNGDARLHENHGHPEGNIDAYAAFRLCGERALAEKVRTWLDTVLKGRNLPLDLYTWRVLAYGREAAPLLDVPEFDLRYRKTLEVRGRKVAGFYHSAEASIDNIWLDGTGHIACAYLLYGDRERGNFYSNQLDALLIDREVGGVRTRSLPYTLNAQGGFEWVKADRGFASCAAWYIFAKNRFNPLRLESAE